MKELRVVLIVGAGLEVRQLSTQAEKIRLLPTPRPPDGRKQSGADRFCSAGVGRAAELFGHRAPVRTSRAQF